MKLQPECMNPGTEKANVDLSNLLAQDMYKA